MFEYGTLPYTEMQNQEVIKAVNEGYRLSRPKYANDLVWEIMCCCFAESKDRITFKDIIQKLRPSITAPQINLSKSGEDSTNYEPINTNNANTTTYANTV